MAVTWRRLAYEDDVILKTLFAEQSVLISVAADSPAPLTVTEQTLVGRKTGGNVEALSVGDLQTLLNVANGADVTGDNAPQAHAASHKNGQGDEILLHEFGEPTGAVDMAGQELENPVLHQVADDTALNVLTPVVGKFAMQIDTLAPYVCTVDS